MDDIRWQQRFQNYSNAFEKFTLAHTAYTEDKNNILFQMALIQSFEFTFELAWKTVKDYLKFKGVDLKLPREVLKEGFRVGILKNGQQWINMMNDRNATSHTYDDKVVESIANNIISEYWVLLKELRDYFDSIK
ncbi:MAG: HI0074 family nucleotidyltransferase substrate-binding subunit [Bdellovibrionota bacterium]